MHYSLVSWAGGWGDGVDRHRDRLEPASASGTLLALRRAVFEELGGFHEMLFAYGEDVELSLRAWQSGYRVRYVPTARVWHRYRFGRHPGKLGLLERNRWINLLTLLEFRTLLRLAPGLLAVDAGVWVSALRGGWLRDKARATAWLLGHGRSIRDRRAWVQGRRRLPDAAILPLLATRIEPSARTGELVPDGVNTLISALGRLAGAGQEQPANAERARSGGS